MTAAGTGPSAPLTLDPRLRRVRADALDALGGADEAAAVRARYRLGVGA